MSLLKVTSKHKVSPAHPGINTRAGLWLAIVISLGLHIFALYHWTDKNNLHISLGQSQFSALIVAPDNETKEQKHSKPVTRNVANKKPTPIAKPATRQLAKAENINAQQSTETKQQQTQRSQNAVRGNIQSHLSQYLSYPEFARRKGWQGIVIVTLKVNESGHLKDIRVNSSSGFDILDNTALEALHKLNSIEIKREFKLALNTQLEIPIHFKLQGS